ncbi:hypothetical protein NW768_002343 [Fusarium equiseti]|uniref:Uncharacterized protein n=1 Tax=Fusarium equiseti TaxID=61235 RepID=A0ABQ8RNH3_FUSEQ|nr:hypothetical protein NW768_002343 [Fusarium equiseti]
MSDTNNPSSQMGRNGASPPTTAAVILDPQHWSEMQQPKANGSNDEDDGTAMMSDSDSTMASIASSILQYRTIHGRTYHSEQGNAQYWFDSQI